MSEEIKNSRVEEILVELQARIENEVKTSEVIAKSADELVAATKEKYDSLVKAVSTIEEQLATLTERLSNLASAFSSVSIPTSDEIEKTIELKAEEIAKNISTKLDEKVEIIEKTISAENELLIKKVEVLENQPIIKSISSNVEIQELPVITKVEEQKEVITRESLIKNALAQLQSSTDSSKKNELFKKVALLESGCDISTIKL